MTNPDPDPYRAIRRRPPGRREWKVTILELIESERQTLQILRSLSNRHVNDGETQRQLNLAIYEGAERLTKLHELLQYKDLAEALEAEGGVTPPEGGGG